MKTKEIKFKDDYSILVIKVKKTTLNKVLNINAKTEEFNRVVHTRNDNGTFKIERVYTDDTKGKKRFLLNLLTATLANIVSNDDRETKIANLQIENSIGDFETESD